MQNSKRKHIFLILMTPIIIWLSYQQKGGDYPLYPLDRYNDILGSLATTSVLLDSIFKDDENDSDSEN